MLNVFPVAMYGRLEDKFIVYARMAFIDEIRNVGATFGIYHTCVNISLCLSPAYLDFDTCGTFFSIYVVSLLLNVI